jgi:hypothetical protein
VEQAAAAAARAASIARDARAAQAQAQATASSALADQALTCAPSSTIVSTTGFRVAVGEPASVTVEVRCAVPLADVAVPGMPGTRVLTARVTSPLDTFRGRS